MVLVLFSFTWAKTLQHHNKSQHWNLCAHNTRKRASERASDTKRESKLKRNIHQIYALRVAANVCVERLMLQSCCMKHYQAARAFAYSAQRHVSIAWQTAASFKSMPIILFASVFRPCYCYLCSCIFCFDVAYARIRLVHNFLYARKIYSTFVLQRQPDWWVSILLLCYTFFPLLLLLLCCFSLNF